MPRVAIVGAGVATQRYFIPRLRDLGLHRDAVVISLGVPEIDVGVDVTAAASETEIIERLLRLRVPTILAMPTDHHMTYVRALAQAGVAFAVEKPLTLLSSERRELEADPTLMDRGFALSYYVLEKALPLTFAVRPLPAYLPFLAERDDTAVNTDTAGSWLLGLGDLERVDVDVLETRAASPQGWRRLWTETGGLLALGETSIHALAVLASLLHGHPMLVPQSVSTGIYEPRQAELAQSGIHLTPTYIDVRATAGTASVRVRVGKYMPDHLRRRALVAQFSHGEMHCSFDQRAVDITLSNGRKTHLRVPSAIPNYGIHMALVQSFFREGWDPAERYDDYHGQLRALAAWDTIVDAASATPAIPYGDGGLDI